MLAREVKVGDQFEYAEMTFMRVVALFPVEVNIVYTYNVLDFIYAVNMESGELLCIDATKEVNV